MNLLTVSEKETVSSIVSKKCHLKLFCYKPLHFRDSVRQFQRVARQRGLDNKRATVVFFLGPTKPLPSYVKSSPHSRYSLRVERLQAGPNQNTAVVAGEGGVKTTENTIVWPRCCQVSASFSATFNQDCGMQTIRLLWTTNSAIYMYRGITLGRKYTLTVWFF
jgi:hypothetical protein